ncbi:bifunctional hydroxymethylpyrimidine kinase/phosphomethylpyrimidine kinase [Natronosporangium hydrolyticum]|uniref:Bifunctional hydroxymethylpyrimidine kinase/phosphomethylpyrimidine kinase n=1 Tax=Natronosporangium hydrolyticum TaxID=2811111 RepID=A0A895YC25_9ACTN|nr:bifunctional hydroxymethylpyrimidine kinase/phosphomethylpyrimidine kinase [Natronosporangium hydrolyticum]QSB13805.1 bifunctional hydroxymethylpyrimidine kinase/phosphomethylpyrimidine kinase [Natronosporangium hydrolyticum]
MTTPPVALTIAGSDSGGGAGIQADLKTFAAQRCFGASVITAVTAQNTKAVTDVHPIPPAAVASQLTAVLDDLSVAAVKTGMLGSAEVADEVAARARDGVLPHLVVDPVLISSTGYTLGVVAAIERLLPYAVVATPNVAEAATLLDRPVTTLAEMADAARDLAAGGARCVVVTGGDLRGGEQAVDALWLDGEVRFLRGPRVPTTHNHGSGCTFAAAIAARLAHGEQLVDAISQAKSYVARALAGATGWRIGGGIGPLDHFEWSPSVDSEGDNA